jgi:protein-arginine kinase activator protein McsA
MEWMTNNSWGVYIPTIEEMKANELMIELEYCVENQWFERAAEIRNELNRLL